MSWSTVGSGALAQIVALFHDSGLALRLDENHLSNALCLSKDVALFNRTGRNFPFERLEYPLGKKG